ncbi:hypothetical protein ACLKA6_010716 [Drosophila palustris]
MKKKTSRYLFFALTVTIILGCTAGAIYVAGTKHETVHVKNIMISIVLVLLFQMLIADPIKFVLLAIDWATFPGKPRKYKPYKPDEDDDDSYNRLDFLKQRLKSLRVQMLITERYRDVALNEQYKSIKQDLFLFGKYLLILSCLVLATRDELLYHNTYKAKHLLSENHTNYMGLKNVVHLNQLFDFVASSLVDAFEFGADEGTGRHWVHSEANKMLGVVRLRQLRLLNERFGWNMPQFSKEKYMPNWELPYRRLHYTDKYWRIYEPWLPITHKSDYTEGFLMNYHHMGYFTNYPEREGYVSVIARSKQNSMKILDFLTEYNWLNYNTSAVFMDFTLYNADANMFTVCTLRLEQTPFGGTIHDIGCDSVKLIEELTQMSYGDLIIIIIYIIILMQFTQAFITTIWQMPSKIKSIWYKLDLIIILLNLVVIILIIVRASMVQDLLRRLEGANKLEYLNFRAATRLHYQTTAFIGFLICLTTMRLWKILQFSKVFQLFTKTFSLAWKAMVITMIMILIILAAFGIVFATINGNNSLHFIRTPTSIITSLCFSFGFASEITPQELFHGGKILGIILYAALGFVVSILLVNLFITTMGNYFSLARAERDAKPQRAISFFEYLRVEYNDVISFFLRLPCFTKVYKRNNRTVAQNVQHILERRIARDIFKKALRRKKGSILSTSIQLPPPPKDEQTLQAEYRERIEHLLAISSIMKTQIEILEHLLFFDKEKQQKIAQDPDSPYYDSGRQTWKDEDDDKADDQSTDKKDTK